MISSNTHMEHLEDLVLNNGIKGAQDALSFLESLRDSLTSSSEDAVNATVKWDGAPAIVVGRTDNKLFVSTKSYFNKSPVMYYSPKEIDAADLNPDLADKLKRALYFLKDLSIGPNTVIQGDFLYTKDDIKKEMIDGKRYLVFHPNTIVYAVPYGSELANQIENSELGIVFHTLVSHDMKPFKMRWVQPLDKVWMIDAEYQDLSGSATMTKEEADDLNTQLNYSSKALKRIDTRVIKQISECKHLLSYIKVHHNLHIRQGRDILSPMVYSKSLQNYLVQRVKKEINALKTESGQERKKLALANVISFSKLPMYRIASIFEMQMHLARAKKIIINKLNKASKLSTFLKTNKGFQVTGEEGYVAIDRKGNTVKLVDRLEFSYSNFNPDIIKGWTNDNRR